jgi:hypothetical protein
MSIGNLRTVTIQTDHTSAPQQNLGCIGALERFDLRIEPIVRPDIRQFLESIGIPAASLKLEYLFTEYSRGPCWQSIESLNLHESIVVVIIVTMPHRYQEKQTFWRKKMKTMMKVTLMVTIFASIVIGGDMGNGNQGCVGENCPPPCTENCRTPIQPVNTDTTEAVYSIVAIVKYSLGLGF